MLAALAAVATLTPLDPWVGRCWVADLPGRARDRHCFSTVYGGKHVRDVHVVTAGGKAVYEGETVYSAEGGQTVFTYWNSMGGVGRGTMGVSGGALTFRMTMRGTPETKSQDFDAVWRMTPDGYDVTADGVTRRFRPD